MNEDRGLSFGSKTEQSVVTADFANSRAYVIGINAYKNGIPELRTAKADAERLGHILEEFHGYTVRSFPCDAAPVLANLRELFHEKMPQEVGADDRVLVYFAGHGIALDGEDGPEGYLVPEDANREDRTSFLSMTELNDALTQLPCRHLVLILDCCFAGAFRWSSTRDLSPLPSVIHRERYERYIQDPAWQVITSAAHDQTALDVLSGNTIGERVETGDHSPFAAALFQALKGDADLIPRGKDGKPGGDGVITATELYMYLRDCVETATLEKGTRQTPGLWPLKKHDKGEFILLTPGHELNLPPAPELNYRNNPYRGLKSFEEKHSQLFFGRDDIIEELHGHVSANPLTVVLGASGTGKSSVVKAGLVPHLRNTDGEDLQILRVIRPGKSPLATLASLTLPGEDSGANEADRLDLLRSDENALAARIKVWAESHPSAPRQVLVVDQFEELITLCWDDWERERFIGLLALALDAVPERIRLVVTLRSDFEPQFSECALKRQWMESRYVVPPMSRDELRAAIEGPASVRVLYFQPAELVDKLIDEVNQSPGAMPLLSFTLSELYVRYLERRGDDRCLSLEDYEQLGGVTGSLRSRASELHDKLDGRHQATMQRIMLRMVSAQGGELARRRVPKSELVYPSNEENTRVSTILIQLADARLIVGDTEADGDPFVEPAHDALTRGWGKLLKWTRDAQEEIALRRPLTRAADDFQQRKGATWHADPRLLLLQRVMAGHDNWLNDAEVVFVRASLRRRQRVRLGLCVAFLVLLVLAGLLVFQSGRSAENARNYRISSFNATLASAADFAGVDPLSARKLLVDPNRCPNDLKHEFTWRLLNRFTSQDMFLPNPNPSEAFAFDWNPRSAHVATASSSGQLCIWDAATGELVREVLTEAPTRQEKQANTAVVYSPDGSTIAASFGTRSIAMWRAASGDSPSVITAPENVRILALNYDGSKLSAVGSTGLHMVDTFANEVIHSHRFSVSQKNPPVASHCWRTKRFAYVSKNTDKCNIIVLDTDTWAVQKRSPTLPSGSRRVHFSPEVTKAFIYPKSSISGARVITLATAEISEEGEIDAKSGSLHPTERMLDTKSFECASFENESRLWVGYQDGIIQTWDLSGERPIQIGRFKLQPRHGTKIYLQSIATNGDGTMVAARCDYPKSIEGIHVLRLQPGVPFGGHLIANENKSDEGIVSSSNSSVTSVCFSPTEDLVAVGRKDGSVTLHSKNNGGEVVSTKRMSSAVFSLVFVGKSNDVIVGCDDKLSRLSFTSPSGSGKRRTAEVVWSEESSYRINSIQTATDDPIIVTGSGNDTKGELVAWDMEGKPGVGQTNRGVQKAGHVRSIAVFDAGKQVAVGTRSGVVYTIPLLDFRPYASALASQFTQEVPPAVFDVGHATLYADRHGPLSESRPYSSSTKEIRQSLFNPCQCVAVSQGGDIICSGHRLAVAYVWDLTSGRFIGELTGHEGNVTAVAFSPDGMTLVTADKHTVHFWDPRTLASRGRFKAHGDSISSIVFSKSGRIMATGSADGTVRMWLTD